MENNKLEWYNDHSKFWWSILVWPLFLYGLAKTSLVGKDAKALIFILIVGICILKFMHDSGGAHSNDINDVSAVRQSVWDNSVDCIEEYLKNDYLRDPDSYESIKWFKAEKNADGTYEVMHTFRAKNGFGGMNVKTMTFKISKDGHTVLGYY